MAGSQLVVCRHCGREFTADDRFRGGLVPCPGCGAATEVGGLRDPLWLLLRVGAVAAAVWLGWAARCEFGPGFGVLVGGAVLVGAWLLSRAA